MESKANNENKTKQTLPSSPIGSRGDLIIFAIILQLCSSGADQKYARLAVVSNWPLGRAQWMPSTALNAADDSFGDQR